MVRLPRIHLGSVLVGLGLSAVLVVLMSQSSVSPTFPSGRFTFGPHPRDFVTIREGVPFTVPVGQVFVASAIGPASGSSITRLVVDGVLQYTALPAPDGYHWICTAFPVPGPMVFRAGQSVSVEDNAGTTSFARLWGYLAAESMSPLANPIYPRIEYASRPSDVMSISQGVPFTVPAGKLFVLTALGHRVFVLGAILELRVNSVAEISADFRLGLTPSIGSVPDGLTIPAGSIIDLVSPSTTDGVAWGYLADP